MSDYLTKDEFKASLEVIVRELDDLHVGKLIKPLVELVKRAQARIAALEASLSALLARIETLEAQREPSHQRAYAEVRE
jgi:hypothetical protein